MDCETCKKEMEILNIAFDLAIAELMKLKSGIRSLDYMHPQMEHYRKEWKQYFIEQAKQR